MYCNKAINRDKLIEQFKKADAIVLFDNKIGLQVPGKTIECLALKKPILLINDNPKSPTLDYIIGLDNVYLTNNIQKNIQSAIMDIADDLKENRKYEIPLDYSEFLWDKLINNYVNIIKGDLNKMRSSCLPILNF